MKVKILAVNSRSRSSREQEISPCDRGTAFGQIIYGCYPRTFCPQASPLRVYLLKPLLITIALLAPLALPVPANADSNLAIAPLLPNSQLAGEFQQAARKDIELLDVNDYRRQAVEKLSNEDFQGALKDLNEVIRLEPTDAYAYFLRGTIRYILKDYQGTIEDYNQVLKLDPNNVLVYGFRGDLYSQLGEYQAAIEDYSQVIKLDPNNSSVYLNRGLIRDTIKDYQGAIEDYNQLLKLDPNNSMAYNNRCYTRARGLGDYQGAIADCNESIRLDPENAYAYASRCYTRAGLGDTKAIEDCDRALEINPEYAGGYEDRALARSILEDKSGAIADLKQAAKLYQEQERMFDYKRVQEILKQLQP